jgi:hypothetical protein
MDELDLLLKEALTHNLRRVKAKGTIKRQKVVQEVIHSIYSNPDNWVKGKVVSIIHLGGDQVETSIGVFQESIHKRSNARRLIRMLTANTLDRTEFVHGDHWLEPKVEHHEPDSAADTLAIREYLSREKDIELKPLLKEIGAERLLLELEQLP